MFYSIKNNLDRKLKKFVDDIDARYHLRTLSPLLFKHIKEFILRDGKRARPILFLIGYHGFSKKTAPGLYTSALSIELLHDFMLIHDDIIDKAQTRRDKPTMHRLFKQHLKNYKNVKFSGQDLSLVVGDIMYALALDAFLAIQEEPHRKEKALRKLIETAAFTGCGEFIELVTGLKKLKQMTKNDIYTIYDYKTAYYTFVCPLTTGALLAGANTHQVDTLTRYGMCLGKAFQINDDILGLFGDERKTGKSTFCDLQEAKRTLLIWYAYHHSPGTGQQKITKILSKKDVNAYDLRSMQHIVMESGSFDYAKKQIVSLYKQGERLLRSLPMRPYYKKLLAQYAQQLLS
ncbi:MAG: polyprenyl synthetase family protein [Candidatus Omnitrophica bacterium]|nr:polyprenyl synthetase family protein [Candidatus Omnitrophota bacterium]